MSAQYEPGTVARVTVQGSERTLIRGMGSEWWGPGVGLNRVNEYKLTNIRPLVVLDLPADRANLIRDLMDCARSGAVEVGVGTDLDELADLLIDQIEAQTKPPKPAEPTGLGAVVEDADGKRWTRARSHDHALNWRAEWGGNWKFYADLDAVRVLSEGVPA